MNERHKALRATESPSSPINVGVSRPRAAPSVAIGGLSGAMAGGQSVPFIVPLLFLLTGVCAAALFGLLLPWIIPEALVSPGFPHVLVLVHTATLGWLTMTIMGASLQLAPVIVVSPLRAARFLRWHYPLYLSGVLLLLSGFWWMLLWLLIAGGTLIVLAVIHYAIILGATLAHATKRPLTVRFLVASLTYLCIVVSLGLLAALDFQYGFLGPGFDRLLLMHITLGVIGWLSTTLLGVSYTLVRMFALAHEHTDRLGKMIFVLLNASIVTLSIGFILAWEPLLLWRRRIAHRRGVALRLRLLADAAGTAAQAARRDTVSRHRRRRLLRSTCPLWGRGGSVRLVATDDSHRAGPGRACRLAGAKHDRVSLQDCLFPGLAQALWPIGRTPARAIDARITARALDMAQLVADQWGTAGNHSVRPVRLARAATNCRRGAGPGIGDRRRERAGHRAPPENVRNTAGYLLSSLEKPQLSAAFFGHA